MSQELTRATGVSVADRDDLQAWNQLTGEQKFLLLLEQRMVDGHSKESNRSWAKQMIPGLSDELFNRFVAMVLTTWKMDVTTVEGREGIKDTLRAQYWDVYREAKASGKLKEAIAALDSIGRMEGVEAPTVFQVQGVPTITNTSREIVATLLERASQLAAGQQKRLESKTLDAAFVELKNGKNGHGPS